jgi:hypothetical protein
MEWLEAHRGHYCPDSPGTLDPTQLRLSPLPDADPDDEWEEVDGDGTGYLLMCCGVERPRNTDSKFKFVVEAKGERGFLTMQDYAEQLHRWSMGLRVENLHATAVAREMQCSGPYSRDGKLMVCAFGTYVNVMSENEWIDGHTQRSSVRP